MAEKKEITTKKRTTPRKIDVDKAVTIKKDKKTGKDVVKIRKDAQELIVLGLEVEQKEREERQRLEKEQKKREKEIAKEMRTNSSMEIAVKEFHRLLPLIKRTKGNIRNVEQLQDYAKAITLSSALSEYHLSSVEDKKYYLDWSIQLSKPIKEFWLDFYYNNSKPKYNLLKSQYADLSDELKVEIEKAYIMAFDILARTFDIDAYMIALEWNRKYEDKFYLPRRQCFMNMETIDGEKFSMIQDAQDYIDGKLDFSFTSMPQRLGKAQPFSAKLITPNGYITMGDVKVGDLIATKDGTFTKVMHIFPQGEKDIYKVTFSDGTSTKCCKEHLWTVQTRDDMRKDRNHNGAKYRTIELQEIAKKLKYKEGNKLRNNYRLDYCKPIQFDKKDLKINPYLLGCLIGDGSFMTNTISFSNSEQDIIHKINDILKPQGQELKEQNDNRTSKSYNLINSKYNGKQTQTLIELKELGLHLKHSYDKFIPKEYLLSSIEDRIAILQGLFDTDGHCSKNDIEYTTSSKQLSEDITFLVQSLGGKVSCIERETHYTKNGERTKCRNSFRMHIYSPKNICLVSSNKHLAKYNIKRNNFIKTFDKIKYAGKEECQCIMVEHESHLYLTDNFIVTHNTGLGLFVQSLLIQKDLEKSIFGIGHSAGLAKHFYTFIYNILKDNKTYRYFEIFKGHRFFKSSSEDYTLEIDKAHAFANFTFRSIDGNITGSTEASLGAYGDDLIKSIDEILNPEVADKIWSKLNTLILGRTKDNVPFYGTATLWGDNCPFTRLINAIEQMCEEGLYNRDRVRIRLLAWHNSKGESQFDYEHNLGFTTKHFKRLEATMKEADYALWCAMYESQPISRDGRPLQGLKFFDELPKEKPTYYGMSNDTALGSRDYFASAVGAVYEQRKEVYFIDVIYSKENTDVTLPKVADKIQTYKVSTVAIEEKEPNPKDGRLLFGMGEKLRELLLRDGYRCNIESKSASGETNKRARILSAKNAILAIDSQGLEYKFYFLSEEKRKHHTEYNMFVKNILNWSEEQTAQKRQQDGAPDSLAIFAHRILKIAPPQKSQVLRARDLLPKF